MLSSKKLKPLNSFVIAETQSLSRLSSGCSTAVSYDFKPVNEGLHQMLNLTFNETKRASVARFIAKTRTRLGEERDHLKLQRSLEEEEYKVEVSDN